MVLRFNIRLCESHNHTHTVDITLYYTVFPMLHVEEVNNIIVIVTKPTAVELVDILLAKDQYGL